MKAVVVGGVAGGISFAARARRLAEDAEIVVLERDRYVSYANCGLPYYLGGEITDRDALLVQTPGSLARSLALDVRTGHEVLAIDRDRRAVLVRERATGRQYEESYDALVLSTGAAPGPSRPFRAWSCPRSGYCGPSRTRTRCAGCWPPGPGTPCWSAPGSSAWRWRRRCATAAWPSPWSSWPARCCPRWTRRWPGPSSWSCARPVWTSGWAPRSACSGKRTAAP